MRTLRAWMIRTASLFKGRRLDDEFAAEIESHVQLHVDDNLRAGMSSDQARRHALARLGGVTQAAQRHRERRGIPIIEHLIRDVRFGARSLRRTPNLTAIAILTLGIGIGATTAVFGFVNAALLQPLPIASPEEVVFLNREFLNRDGAFPTFSYPDYVEIRDRNTIFAGVAAYRFAPMNVGHDGSPQRTWGYLASGNYFQTLGVSAALGRVYTAEDDVAAGSHPVVVISHAFWQRRFGRDPSIVGRSITINGRSYSIIGVLPRGFIGTERFYAADLWVPMMMQAQIEPANPWLDRRQTRNAFVIARRKPDVTNAHADSALQSVVLELARQAPQLNEGMRVTLTEPGLAGNMLRGPVVGFSSALAVVAAVVLLLTCTNLTGLLLARAVDRHRQTAICLAIGASRRTLIRQMMIESGLLCAGATALALALTYALAAAFAAWQPPIDFPINVGLVVDQRLFWFAAGVAVLTTVLIGVAPALSETRAELIHALKEEAPRVKGGWPIRDVVVGVQMALSVLLLFGSMLVIRSLHEATYLDVGFKADGVVTARMDLALQGYDQERGLAFQRQLIERLGAHPSIRSVSIGNSIPLSIDQSTNGIYIEGRPEPRASELPMARYYQVWPEFFQTLETSFVAGRDFDSRDGQQRVAIVNEAFVNHILGSGDPFSHRFRSGPRGGWWSIIGVVRTGKYVSIAEDPLPVVFYLGSLSYNSSTLIVARGRRSEAETARVVKDTVRDLAPGLSLYAEQPLSRTVDFQMIPARAAAFALSAFGLLTLLLVALGTYALVSYSIARRTREICIRLAIGASSSDVVRLVLARTAVVWCAGASAGAFLAFAAGPLLSPLLLGNVTPRAPGSFALSAIALAMVAALACWMPTRRALCSDPSGLLRRE